MLALTPLDAAFGAGGLVLGPISTGPGGTDNGAAVVALSVLANGQIITAQTESPTGTAYNGTTLAPLAIHRFNADGSIDPTFGTAGMTTLPNPTTGGARLAVQSDGSIVVLETTTGPDSTFRRLLFRFKSNGQIDSAFGTDGVATLPTTLTAVSSLAVENSGRILVAGLLGTAQGVSTPPAGVVGLTSTGAVDPTFGNAGTATVPLATPLDSGNTNYQIFTGVLGLQLTPTGQILLAVNQAATSILQIPDEQASTLSRLNADGSIDPTFGTSGTLDLPSNETIGGLALQPDGQIVLNTDITTGGPYGSITSGLIRLHADGTVDPSLATVSNVPSGDSLGPIVVAANGEITALSSTSKVYRYLPNGQPDNSFGIAGRASITIPLSALPPNGQAPINQFDDALGLAANGNILVGGSIDGVFPQESIPYPSFSQTLLAQIRPILLVPRVNDLNGDGRSDLAVQLAPLGAVATRTDLGGDSVQLFGLPGAGQSIPAPGDYDGDGQADLAAYLPALGILAYRPSSGGPDVLTRFGPTGVGNAVPAPGDYDGDGKTDIALFVPSTAAFMIQPANGYAPYTVQFGVPGVCNSIPAPGDYDGDGKTDLAVYLPTLGVLAYRPSSGSNDVLVSFGIAGAGQTLPAPGDYNGDGKTDVAAFLPALGLDAYRPSGGGADVLTRFGPTGAGNAVPVPGDYDGDGKTDVALFLPGSSTFAIDPSGGALPFAEQFGAAGVGNSVPATASVVPEPQVSSLGIRSPLGSDAAAAVPVYLPDDLIGAVASTRKKTTA